jgi:hypothetical protein
MSWVGNVIRVEKKKICAEFWYGNPKHGDHLEDVGVHGRILIQWISNTLNGGAAYSDLAQNRR